MKRLTIRDVAKRAGVSIATVSKALNNYPGVREETKRHIEEIAQEMDYVPDAVGRSMGGISDPVIGLLINNLVQEDQTGAVYGYLSGVCHVCKGRNIGLVLIPTDLELQLQTPLQRLCLGKRLTGIICSGFRASDPYVDQIRSLNIPCVCIDFQVGCSSVMEITIDNTQAADDAVTFLIRSGRKNIAYLTATQEIDVTGCRGQGYWNALNRAGYPFLPHRVLEADFKQKSAYQKAGRLLREDPAIDAFFCTSDLMALGVCQAVEEAGMTVGRDVSVMGFDDIPVARFLYGGLTTVRQDFYQMGRVAGYRLQERILGEENMPANISSNNVLYELVIRGSAPKAV